MSGNHSYIELMIICPASGCGYFIGDQDYDANWLRCTIFLGSCASSIKDASTQLTRHGESACASTQGIVLRCTILLGSCASDPPDLAIAEGFAASAREDASVKGRGRNSSLMATPTRLAG